MTGPRGWRSAEAAAISLLLLAIALAFNQRIQIQFTLPKLFWFFAGSAVIAMLWARRAVAGEVKPIPKLVLIPALLLLTWWAITALLAADPRTAMFGMHGRYNGLITQATLIGLFLAFASADVTARDLRGLAMIAVLAVVPAAAYAAAQELGYDWFVWPNPRPAATFGHPVPLAATLGLVIPIALALVIAAATTSGRIVWGSVLALLLFATAATLSRGPWAGVIVAMMLVLFASHRRGVINLRAPAARWVAAIVAAILVLPLNSEVLSRFSMRVSQLVRLNQDPSFAGRFVYFDAALAMVKDRPITGVGLENFGVLYPRYRPVEPEHIPPDAVPTMVHNGYLQAAATTGIPGLVMYLALIGGVFVMLIRRLADRTLPVREWLIGLALAAAIAGYLAQDSSGWLEISLSVFFWICAGAAVSFSSTVGRSRIAPSRAPAAAVAAIAFAAVGVMLSVQTLRAIGVDAAFYESHRLDPAHDWLRIQENVTTGLRVAGEDPYYLDAAGVLYLKRFHATGDREAFNQAATLFDRARASNTFDPYVLIHRIDLETAALQRKVLTTPTTAGERWVESLLQLDPNNATVHETVARYRAASGRIDEAFQALDRAIRLRPSHPRFYALRGDLLRARGDRDGAAQAFREESARVPAGSAEWLTAEHKLMVMLAETGRHAAVIDEGRYILAQVPNDDLAYTLIGLAHQSMRDVDQAKTAFEKALRINPRNTTAERGLQLTNSR